MTTFSIPNRPAGSAVRSIAQITANFDSIINQLNGQNLDPANFSESLVNAPLGLSDSDSIRRGKSIISTTESRTNTAYGTMTTPDQVANVVVPTDGLLWVGYHATWQESVVGAARAAIFVGPNQLVATNGNLVNTTNAEASCGTGVANRDELLFTTGGGLTGYSAGLGYAGDATTGQALGAVPTSSSGFVIPLFVAPGTYTVSVQFKASSGSVTAKNRKLWVWTTGF